MIAAAVAMAAAAAVDSGASAGFRYVPPPAPAPAVAGPEAGEPARAGSGGWRVHAGETLREALDRWGARAGADVVFLTDRRYRLGEARTFGGGFGEAARALFAALAHLPRPPVGELSDGGRALTVRHRAPDAGGGR